MRSRRTLGIALFAILAAGCASYRTTYVNLYPPGYSPPSDSVATNALDSGLRHFFISGLVPSELEIDSAGFCGEGYVKEIHTERAYVHGVISSYTFGIYAPWTGKTVCQWGSRE